MLAQALCAPEHPPPPTPRTRLTAETCPGPPHPGKQCSTNNLELITWCVPALGQDGRVFYSEEAPDTITPGVMAESWDQPTVNHRKKVVLQELPLN